MKTKNIKKIRVFYFSCRTIFILSILLKIVQWQLPTFFNQEIKFIISSLIYVSGVIMSLFQMLKVFEPLEESPNWELVFPELKNSYID